MNICVHTSPGRRGEAEPHVFFVGGRRLIVATVLDRWTAHTRRYFEVRCEDGRRFLLCLDTTRKSWELAGVYAASFRPASLRPPMLQPSPALATPGEKPAARSFIARWWR